MSTLFNFQGQGCQIRSNWCHKILYLAALIFSVYASFCQRLSYDQFQTPCVFCLSLFHEMQRPSCTILIQLCVSLGYDPCLVVLLSCFRPYMCASYLSSWFHANITVFLILYSTFWIWRLCDFICWQLCVALVAVLTEANDALWSCARQCQIEKMDCVRRGQPESECSIGGCYSDCYHQHSTWTNTAGVCSCGV